MNITSLLLVYLCNEKLENTLMSITKDHLVFSSNSIGRLQNKCHTLLGNNNDHKAS
jgi:hypothetical protein